MAPAAVHRLPTVPFALEGAATSHSQTPVSTSSVLNVWSHGAGYDFYLQLAVPFGFSCFFLTTCIEEKDTKKILIGQAILCFYKSNFFFF